VIQRAGSCQQIQPPFPEIIASKGKIFEERSHLFQSRTAAISPATVRDFLVIYVISRSHGLSTLAFGRICILCELLHVVKERSRLANEKSHGGEECESPGGGAFRVRWPNDRNNRKAPT
jgi:hypothetical protein